MAQTVLVRGQVAYVNPESGCGFITTKETEQDVLFLRDSVEGSVPDVGEDVRFELIETQDGPRARDIRV
ncbi:cold-shock protein [Halococcus sp. AFM35]|uniref:cold-shock protein n=1 Tax=Halococcus sp. AFM35 TaxID=3421653 RepID=UPI003EB7219F